MTWSERQQAWLRGLGLRVWAPASPGAAIAAPPEPPAMPVPVQAQSPVPAPARPAPGAATRPAARPTPGPAPAIPSPAPAAIRLAPAISPDMDWPTLRQAVASCRACSLCEGRQQTVFGTGHLQAHWMVVGEAPGEQEDRSGLPFVGPAGQLLDRMLAALQLTRADDGPAAQRVFIANTLKCRPPHNRNPAPEELAQCEPYLQRQIELLQPRMILAMGRFAVDTLLRSAEPIGRLRGRIHRYHGVPLVVTYHPAYLLRNLQDKARAWEDLCLAADVVQGLVPGQTPP